jgi:hypothetical protein
MIARVISFVLLLAATAASAKEQTVTISDHGTAVATLSVPADAKITTIEGKTVVDTKELTLYVWVVAKAKTVADAVPLVGEVIKSEFKDFKVDQTKTLTVAEAQARHLMGRGKEADDNDPGSADVVLFAVGKTVLAACVHGEDQAAPHQRPAMLAVLKTVKAP